MILYLAPEDHVQAIGECGKVKRGRAQQIKWRIGALDRANAGMVIASESMKTFLANAGAGGETSERAEA